MTQSRLVAVSVVLAVGLCGCPTPMMPEDGGAGGGGGATTVRVKVTLGGNGTGTVSSASGGLSCPGTCTIEVQAGTEVVLTATAAQSSSFVGWTGGCTGTGTCRVTPTADVSLVASFALRNSLVVARDGNGAGAITSVPAGIDCGTDCSEEFAADTQVTLSATPETGSIFTGWSGACSGTTTTCVVTASAAQMATATFTLTQAALTVTLAGTGRGRAVSTPVGIDCGTDCTEAYDYGTMVTLTATPEADSDFTGWSGACSGTSACTLAVTAATSAVATFALKQHAVTVTLAGNGTGTVTSAPTGIDCGADCTETYTHGTMVTLSAAPAVGSNFTGWSGACSGTGACTVSVTAAQNVSATFELQTFTLTVSVTSPGGEVTSMPTGVSCGSDCTEVYSYGTMVTLTAVPDANGRFVGWQGGGCAGTGTCVVGITGDVAVSAAFARGFPLQVQRLGSGSGTVTSSPNVINCGTQCTADVDANTMVTLTAAPDSGSRFAGWSGGGCSGTGICQLTINAATSVTATFIAQSTLAIVRSGNGTGYVGSNPLGLDCGATCSAVYDNGTAVILSASPTGGSTFTGWSGGGCSGTGGCTVTVSADTTITATFTP